MLYIIYRDYSVANYILAPLFERDDICLVRVDLLNLNYLERIIYYTERKLAININPKKRYSQKNLKELASIRNTDKILLFDFMEECDVKYITTHTKTHDISLWIWNTLAPFQYSLLESFKKMGIKLFTFDPGDSKRLNICFLNQVYRAIPLNQKEILYDFFFIGQDKGRSIELNNLAGYLRSHNYRVKFVLQAIKGKDYSECPNLEIIYVPWEYSTILHFIAHSKALVDVMKDMQIGITLRVLEAAFYQKKLLTFNSDIVHTDLYNSQNILVMGKNSISTINEFMDTDYQPYSKDVLSKYQIDTWISSFI